MITIKTQKPQVIDQTDPSREVLFSVDGKHYTIPKKVKVSDALGYATVARRQGGDIAMSWAMELLLGSEGLTALINSEPSDEDMQRCIDVILGRVQGLTLPIPSNDEAVAADEAPKAVTAKAS